MGNLSVTTTRIGNQVSAQNKTLQIEVFFWGGGV